MRDVVAAVIGPGTNVPPGVLAAAEDVGARLARAGVTVVCGGLGGVMAAVARGARAHDGEVIGLLPGATRSEGNEHLTVAVPTGLGEGRNLLVVRTADVVIAVGGGDGTLSEIGFALKLGRPVIGLDTWQLARDGVPDRRIVPADDPAAAVAAALAAAGERAAPGAGGQLP